jgi:ubiquinone/menaquinone biosynthesis C-methylase UbiE
MLKVPDVDQMMYDAGIDVLHPGGLEKTDEMARLCGIGPGQRVLDVGSGRGASACHLARRYDCDVTGTDCSQKMVVFSQTRARCNGLGERVHFMVVDACALPFPDGSFDLVLAECVTTMLDTEGALREMIRVVAPGGHVGDLEMTWRKPPPEEARRETAKLWDGYATRTLPEWQGLMERLGLAEVQSVDFSEAIPRMEATMRRQLGLKGELRIALRLLLSSNLRRATRLYARVFHEYADYIGAGYVVGRKPSR